MRRSTVFAFSAGIWTGVAACILALFVYVNCTGCVSTPPPEPIHNVSTTSVPTYTIDSTRCPSALMVDGQCVPLDVVAGACSPRDAWCESRCFRPKYSYSCIPRYDGCYWRCQGGY